MIRLANKNDISRINEIGLILHDNFNTLFNMEELLDTDYVKVYVYEEDNIIKGFLHTEYHFEITDIINVVVDKAYQSNNIGYELINYLFNNTESEKIMLEVNENNIPAIKLYNKCNFVEIHRRKKYYGEDDAIIMERGI